MMKNHNQKVHIFTKIRFPLLLISQIAYRKSICVSNIKGVA